MTRRRGKRSRSATRLTQPSLPQKRCSRRTATSSDAADKQKVEDGVTAVKTALSGENPDEIKKAMETLTEAVYAATTKIYQKMQAEQTAQQQGAQPGDNAGPSSAEPEKKQDDNVVNADYKVKDE